MRICEFRIGRGIIKSRVAETEEEKCHGFIGSSKVEPEDGILFLGLNSGTGFHMRGVNTDLGILFLDENYKVLKKEKMLANQAEFVHAPNGTRYALEISSDLLNSVQVGSQLDPEFEVQLSK